LRSLAAGAVAELVLIKSMPHPDELAETEPYYQQLKTLAPRIRELVPDWTPQQFDNAVSYTCYVSVVESALDHAASYDLVELQSGPFSDGLDMESDYYLEFTRDPTAEEIRRFQAALFCAYLEAESEEFDHLAILKRVLPMVRATLM